MLPFQHNPQLVPGSCRWNISCRSQVPSGCRVPGADPQRSRSWGLSSAAPGPWSWCSRGAQPAPGTPPGSGGSLLHGTGWECAPGGRNEQEVTSHAGASLPSMVRAGEGTSHDHRTLMCTAVLLGPCNRVILCPFTLLQPVPPGPRQQWGWVGVPCPDEDLPVPASPHWGVLWC